MSAETATLITGASGGLGEAFAHEEARRGHHVLLVARRTEELERVAADVRAHHGVKADVLACDLGDRTARARLIDTVAVRGLTVDTLINNAGFGTMGDFAEADVDRMQLEIELNCVALTQLTRSFLPGMLAAGQGRVVNVASTAAFQPLASMAVYAATKAYVLRFSTALWEEVRRQGVQVLALCPGPTDTGFFDAAHAEAAMTQRRTVQQVMDSCYTALDKGKPYVVDGAINTVMALAAGHLPLRVTLPVSKRVMQR